MKGACLRVVLVGSLLTVVCPAFATDVSRQELERLAASAQTSETSRSTARSITAVDGQPIDMAAILEGASDDQIAGRLDGLSSVVTASSSSDANATARARDILASEDYTDRDFPKPVRQPVEWIADHVQSVLDWLNLSLPGGAWVVWMVLGGLMALVVAVTATTVVRRRAAGGALRTDRGGGDVPGTPTARQLDAQAETAERAGDLRAALRLRFQAGLMRLGSSHVIDSPDTATGDQLARRLQSGRFDRLRRTFDEVVYGGRTVTASDLAEARAEWPAVTDEARRR